MRCMSSSRGDLQNPSMTRATINKPSTRILVLVLFVLLYAALAFGMYNGLTRNALGANDFYSRWMGARALFLRGENPYADAVTREIQLGMYGRLAQADEDQVAFVYPLYAAYFAAPLVRFPYAAAQALWMALLVMGVVGGALALAFVNRIELSPPALAALLLGTLLFYPSVRGVFLGQYALLSFALVAFAGLAIARGHDTTAGVLLSLSSAKPQPILFLFPVILFWAWWNGRRRVVWSALATLALLIVSATLWIPSWFPDFLNGLSAYARYAPVGPPLETFFNLWLAAPLASILTLPGGALLVFGMALAVWRDRTASWYEFQPTLGLVALVTTLVAGRIGTPDQVLLLIPWIAWFGVWQKQRRRLVPIVCVLLLLALPWTVFFNLLRGNQEAIVVTTVLPLFTLAVAIGLTFDVSRPAEAAG